MRLDGKVAIITGGNSGIGKATALLFAKEGAKVVITARREKQLQKVSEEILAMGGNVLAVASDISNPAECTKVVNETLEKFGKLDILVNNAGILDHGTAAIDSVKDEDINAVIDINAKGTIYFTREVAKVMAEQKSGAIVNTASVAGVVGNGGNEVLDTLADLLPDELKLRKFCHLCSLFSKFNKSTCLFENYLL